MTTKLADLYQKYINNTCTKEEQEEFLLMVSESSEDGAIERLMDDTWDKLNTEQLLFPAANSVLNNILLNEQVPVVKKISWFRDIAATAAILAIISTGIYFYQNTKSNPVLQSETTAILPGKNKATLTLANGTVINLDHASNGQLAQQTGIKITKTTDGQLVYEITEQNKKEITSAETAYNTITTPRGGQYQVNLPDGTKVWLNAASSLKYPLTFGKNQRTVELRGEAYFEVATVLKNEKGSKKKPFTVKTDKQEVEVLGTHFNINSYVDENLTKTTLLEGIVRVKTTTFSPSSSVLKPGQQAVLNNNILTLQTVDTEEAIAWKNGFFQFNESDLGSIMKQLSRWYDVDIVFEGRSPNDLFHFKAPKDQNLTEIIKIFEINGINLKIEGRKLIVKS